MQVLLAVRDWVANFMISLPFLLGAGMYYYLMYRSTIVPKWLSAWGLLGVAVSAPIGLQEMVLAGWLIAKGFNQVPERPAAAVRP